MGSVLPGGDLREETLLACYFFHGEEIYLVEEFLAELKSVVAAASTEEFHLERVYLGETNWPEIIDSARTAPFLFHSWRVLVVWIPERSPASELRAGRKGGKTEGGRRRGRFLGSPEEKLLESYFEDPPARTVLVVVEQGRIRRDDPLLRLFSSFPKSKVMVREIRPFTAYQAKKWADRKALALGKVLSEGARDRLYDIVGSDLRLLANELDKLAVFAGERKVIEAEDVDAVTAWVRSFESYEMDDILFSGDFEKGLKILNGLFMEGFEPEQVVGRLAAFFQNILSAQARLRAGGSHRRDIFAVFFPAIKESYQDLYRRKFSGFFGVVDGLSASDLNAVLAGLREVDWKVKTTDGDAEIALEAWLKEYCDLVRRRGAPAPGPPRSA
jgi:DNA polymerase-3 subunit delta